MRVRTADLLNANQMLYQLSYTPAIALIRRSKDYIVHYAQSLIVNAYTWFAFARHKHPAVR